jgi:hypothetical protein
MYEYFVKYKIKKEDGDVCHVRTKKSQQTPPKVNKKRRESLHLQENEIQKGGSDAEGFSKAIIHKK